VIALNKSGSAEDYGSFTGTKCTEDQNCYCVSNQAGQYSDETSHCDHDRNGPPACSFSYTLDGADNPTCKKYQKRAYCMAKAMDKCDSDWDCVGKIANECITSP